MKPGRKPCVTIRLPAVPEHPHANDVIVALGRLTMAWSASEFYLALIMSRLMARADLSTMENLLKAMDGEAVMISDTNAVFALFFAVESSRGRRKLVLDLAEARHGEGYLYKASFDEIKALLKSHGDIARLRNRYAHTAMGLAEDGSYILLDGKMILTRIDGTQMQRNAKIRANNNKVNPKMIDDATNRIADWIDEARSVCSRIATSIEPGPSPPTTT
ncbi:hypothetical protein [Shinella sp. BYT-45]|uniref:hypothetical protein n=1 Tax=Shinella sp. BYT-45 TaxID=3377377 RepID=UPI00397EAF38